MNVFSLLPAAAAAAAEDLQRINALIDFTCGPEQVAVYSHGH